MRSAQAPSFPNDQKGVADLEDMEGRIVMELPSYDRLPVIPNAPPHSSWGVWGPDDVFGCLNLLSPEKVIAAARLVRTGKVFALNWPMELPDPALFGRRSPEHRVLSGGAWQDDELNRWNTQSSTQWDGFRHARAAEYGYYAGLSNEKHGIHHWARKGIVGRGVLVDIGRYRDAIGRPLRMLEPDPITVQELAASMAESQLTVREGDILLLRTGWIEWYMTVAPATRRQLASNLSAPGLQPGRDLLAFLWNLHIAAIAADNPSVELYSSAPVEQFNTDGQQRDEADAFAHYALLPLLGLPLGELFNLGALAVDCAEDGCYEGLFTSAPLNLMGGVASPPNALLIK